MDDASLDSFVTLNDDRFSCPEGLDTHEVKKLGLLVAYVIETSPGLTDVCKEKVAGGVRGFVAASEQNIGKWIDWNTAHATTLSDGLVVMVENCNPSEMICVYIERAGVPYASIVPYIPHWFPGEKRASIAEKFGCH